MCIALPLGPLDNESQSKLWRFIRSTPLNMLLFSVLLQIIALFFVNILSQDNELGATITEFSISASKTYSLNYISVQFWIFPFITYALLMNFYPRLCKQGEIEYLQYAALNTLGNVNLIFFYIAGIYFNSLIKELILIHELFRGKI